MRPTIVRAGGVAVLLAALVGLSVGAAWGTGVVASDRSPARVAQAHLDDAYYHCLEVQARSLVRPGETVAITTTDLGGYVTLFKTVAGWARLAPPGTADLSLSLRRGLHAPACLGDVVVGTKHQGGRTVVVRGEGANVPGSGPPPVLPY